MKDHDLPWIDMDVVLVEDSPLIAALLLDKLRQRPELRVVGEADEEDAAVSVILERKPEAVILDLGLRMGNGFGVLKRLREAGSDACVLVLTNSSHLEIRNACLSAGASHFFDKHTQSDDCVQTLVGLHALRNGNVPGRRT